MEILKKKRRVIRAQATRIINEADDILAKQQVPDIVAVSGLIERLLLVEKQLSDVNAAIEPHILEEDADAEFEQAMEYDDKIASCLGSMKSFGKNHMQGLIDLKPVTSARNVRELRRLYDDLQVHMRGLKALGVGEDSYNTTLYPVLLRALPQEIVLNYHRSQPDLCTSSTDGSSPAGSATVHHTALTTLLRYFRRELESQERALEHGTDNSIDQQTEPIPRLFSELEGVGVSDTPEKLPDVQIMEQFTKGNKTVDGRYEHCVLLGQKLKLTFEFRQMAQKEILLSCEGGRTRSSTILPVWTPPGDQKEGGAGYRNLLMLQTPSRSRSSSPYLSVSELQLPCIASVGACWASLRNSHPYSNTLRDIAHISMANPSPTQAPTGSVRRFHHRFDAHRRTQEDYMTRRDDAAFSGAPVARSPNVESMPNNQTDFGRRSRSPSPAPSVESQED
ncbi:hypothetical protein HPB50_007568 [Hyalomma asiaticum]|uniref:Uncharacterized protein n=1 Tax=Hyalomma asiaticum TaxID=266040 RepID=A0ACB7TE35_HYAAI|nr:hypothetical protein HPB50_007568 [Hyalomma asiaticum]